MRVQTQTASLIRRTGRSLVPRIAPAAVALSLLAGCAGESTLPDPEASFSRRTGPGQTTFYGAATHLGEGLARTYLIVQGGAVVEVGVALSETALQGLPAGHGGHGGGHAHSEHLLAMHPRNPTPYRFVELNWVPDGHPIAPYGEPHFDFHFYTISPAERNAIDPADPQWAQKANHLPAPGLVPAGYVPALPPTPGSAPADVAVPRMGVHWLNPASPELNGAPYTDTFLYGSWDGKIIFAEPMITKAFLESKPTLRRELPGALQDSYPGSYRVYWNGRTKEHRVALTDLPAR